MPDPNHMACIYAILSLTAAARKLGYGLPDAALFQVQSWRILDAARVLWATGGFLSITLYSNTTCGEDADMWVWNTITGDAS